MARPLRIEFPGGVYHGTSRGDRREPIFGDDQDRACLIDVLAQALDRFDGAMLAYCLMGNHYHLVLQTRRANLSRLMRHVNGVYAQAFNRRHGLVGHLFQGRFTAIHVDRDAYLMEVCRYTELNPVRARMVDAVADWPWSSYRAHCGLTESPRWLDTAVLHGYLVGRSCTRSTTAFARRNCTPHSLLTDWAQAFGMTACDRASISVKTRSSNGRRLGCTWSVRPLPRFPLPNATNRLKP